jgi:hypothetical protein
MIKNHPFFYAKVLDKSILINDKLTKIFSKENIGMEIQITKSEIFERF